MRSPEEIQSRLYQLMDEFDDVSKEFKILGIVGCWVDDPYYVELCHKSDILTAQINTLRWIFS